jgi:hypothetical protein
VGRSVVLGFKLVLTFFVQLFNNNWKGAVDVAGFSIIIFLEVVRMAWPLVFILGMGYVVIKLLKLPKFSEWRKKWWTKNVKEAKKVDIYSLIGAKRPPLPNRDMIGLPRSQNTCVSSLHEMLTLLPILKHKSDERKTYYKEKLQALHEEMQKECGMGNNQLIPF